MNKYSYASISILVSYDDITIFEDLTNVCTFVYEIEERTKANSRERNTD